MLVRGRGRDTAERVRAGESERARESDAEQEGEKGGERGRERGRREKERAGCLSADGEESRD
eukprot:6206808-Pleurochrysis_carterae.AAC.3